MRSDGRFLAFMVCAAAALHPATACSQSPSDGGSRDRDLDALVAWVDLERSWPEGGREEALRGIEELRAVAGAQSDAQFFLSVASIVALTDNGHSNVGMVPVYSRWGLLPIRMFDFDDGPRVVRATAEQADLLGARVDRIGGRTVDDLVSAFDRYHGGTIDFLRVHFGNPLLLSPQLLHAAGLIESPDSAEMEFRLVDGTPVTRTLSAWDGPKPHPSARPWQYLGSPRLSNENGAWVTAMGRIELPWSLQEMAEAFRYRFLPEAGVAHIQFRQNIGTGRTSVRDFARSVEARLREDQPRHIILDNRQNGGGDLTRSADFARGLHEFLPADGRVFSLTSRATFSAGIYTAFFPKAAAPARTLVVGTRVADRDRFWAEAGTRFRLPDSGMGIGYSLEMHDPVSGCSEPSCHLRRREALNIAVGSLEPDVMVPTLWEDFATGRDPQVAWVLESLAAGGAGAP